MQSLLLTDKDSSPFRVVRNTSEMPIILLCDHASNRVPEKLNNLGLSDSDLLRHFAIDIGAAEVTQKMADLLGCTAVLCNFSRLAVDCNRHPDHPSAMTVEEDGFTVRGNIGLTAADRQRRIDEIFLPYHAAIAQHIERLEKDLSRQVCVVAMHSFTPLYHFMPRPRPWHIGVMWSHDAVTSQALLAFLRARPELEVGDNQPYSLMPTPERAYGSFTFNHYAVKAQRPGVQIEIRNDEIITKRGIDRYAAMLADFFSDYHRRMPMERLR